MTRTESPASPAEKPSFPRVTFDLSNTSGDRGLGKRNLSNDVALDTLGASAGGQRATNGAATKKMVTFQPSVQFDNSVSDKTFV